METNCRSFHLYFQMASFPTIGALGGQSSITVPGLNAPGSGGGYAQVSLDSVSSWSKDSRERVLLEQLVSGWNSTSRTSKGVPFDLLFRKSCQFLLRTVPLQDAVLCNHCAHFLGITCIHTYSLALLVTLTHPSVPLYPPPAFLFILLPCAGVDWSKLVSANSEWRYHLDHLNQGSITQCIQQWIPALQEAVNVTTERRKFSRGKVKLLGMFACVCILNLSV